MQGFIYTVQGITVVHRNRPVSVSVEDPRFAKINELIARKLEPGADPVTDEEFDAALASPKEIINTFLRGEQLSDKISVSDTAVLYNGKPVHNSLTRRLLEHWQKGISVKPLVPFLENLMLNPSYRAVQDLYEFLERGSIPLTTDGHFLAYKYVREDYMDVHSGTFDNSVGKICEMPRNEVDEDPNRTCSNGLHACSFQYLGSYSPGQRVMVVKINPRDVVAIPSDYNLSKMRVCRYEVVGEVDELRKQEGDFLSKKPVFDEWDRPSYDGGSEPFPDEVDDGDEYPYALTVYDKVGNVFHDDKFMSWDDAEEEWESLVSNYSNWHVAKGVITGPSRRLELTN